MAEIVRTEQRTTKTSVNHLGAAEPKTTLTITTEVRSIYGGDVSMVRNFMQALVVSGAPDTAPVSYVASDGRLSGLVARWTRIEDVPEEAAAQ